MRNKIKNQEHEAKVDQRDPRETDGGLRRYTKGGIAMTIVAAPEAERSRSGSQPRYPYMDREPFQVQQDDSRARNNMSSYDTQGVKTSGKRVPKELGHVESTIK